MGIFNKNKKNNDDRKKESCTIQDNKLIFNQEKGMLEFYDFNKPSSEDITRLRIKNYKEFVNGTEIYECLVSYYGSDHVQFYNDNGELMDSRWADDYKKILVGLDLNKLIPGSGSYDKEYSTFLFRELLNRERVEKYLRNNEVKCGNYVGEVKKDDKRGYYKKFMPKYGEKIYEEVNQKNKDTGER